MMTLASPHTTIPIPIPTSANPWYCASKAPDSATKPFEIAIPNTIMFPSFTPRARIICTLSPVARIAMPRFVRKNQYNRAPVSRTVKTIAASTIVSRTLTSQPARSKLVAPRIRFTPIRSDCVASVFTPSSEMLLLPMT